jgi:hypothetical protein
MTPADLTAARKLARELSGNCSAPTLRYEAAALLTRLADEVERLTLEKDLEFNRGFDAALESKRS